FPPMSDFPTWYGTDRDLYVAGGAYWYDDANTAHAIAGRDFGFEIYGDCNPVADFTYYTDNLTLYVNASQSYAPDGGTIDSYDWDWNGDGTYENTSSGATFNHTYDAAGDYTVKLRVTDDDGHTDVKSRTVSVTEGGGGYPPHAYFTYYVENYTVYANASQSYDTDGTITSYLWDWDGDGFYDDTESDPLADHTYAANGSYNVTLKVQDDQGNTDTYTRTGVQIPAEEEEEDDGGGGWANWNLDLSWAAIMAMVGVVMLGGGTTAYFMKEEIRSELGIWASMGTLFAVIFIIAAIIIYYSDMPRTWLYADAVAIVAVVGLTVNYYLRRR
ncbi:MAG: PKD domain-containing protein, partial [Thermoplasmatota archaeon]